MRRFLPLALLAACAEPPAPAPTVAVTGPADTVIVPVRHVSDAVALANGRWAVLGIEELEVRVADFATGEAPLHPGITREEVPGATVLFGGPDTLWVGDWALRRVTAWLGDGRRIDAVPTPDALRGAFPRTRDAAGQWYFELAAPPGRDGAGISDSGAVVRADALMERFDTVARLQPPEATEVLRNGAMRLQPLALAGRDRWGALDDGTVWVARKHLNRLDWYPPGGAPPVGGKPLPDPVIAVSPTDRELYRLRFPEEQRVNIDETQFAWVKPPFERAFADERGRVWLFKSAVALDTIRTFQVVDTTGVLHMVTVPSYGVAVGISEDAIVMAEEFPAGVRLLRYARPGDPPPPTATP